MPVLPKKSENHPSKIVTELPNSAANISKFTDGERLTLLKCFASRATKDLLTRSQGVNNLQEHLQAAISWLKRSHDVTPDDGVSWGYSLKGGWRPSYRETSGYIAVTFFNLAQQLNDNDARERAIAIAKWLCQIQNNDGSISNPRYASTGIVFDTGQVLFGLVRAFQETQNPLFFQAAEKAGNWLVKIADSDGKWTRNTHNNIPHVYNTRTAWALLQLNSINPKKEYEKIAKANLDWALTQQHNGLFQQCAFTEGVAPFTHTIAYTIRGLFESSILLDEDKYLNAAILAAETMLKYVRSDGFIPGQIDLRGNPQGNYSCLTGNCQMAIIWCKLFQRTADQVYYWAAADSLRYVMSYQDIRTSDLNIFGGIKGSQPIWGKYTRLSYPNWAAKFFVDALMMLSR
ncbi:prenyltransferase/squalene oxidase repeat-containing protein [Aerosakkonemataceae cyanobacterium BLCC-F154]|uniref:Prenyltransferase/squalene oxidase repeat-containing protein n=1 Tax=Floridaenema fluviatile BLCC-F154 TaxID=3153640 RepID=A0ABV4Y6X8_9CYAN